MSTLARRQHLQFLKSTTGALIECQPHHEPGDPDNGEPGRTVWEPAQLRLVSRQRARTLRRRGVAVHTQVLRASGKVERYWFALVLPPPLGEEWAPL